MAEVAGKGSGTRAPGAPGGGIVGEPVTDSEAQSGRGLPALPSNAGPSSLTPSFPVPGHVLG